MINLLIFILFFYILLVSTIGYGILFKNLCFGKINDFEKENSIFIGFYGLFFLTLISTFSNLFFPHNFLHNSILHLIGLLSFIFLRENEKKYI